MTERTMTNLGRAVMWLLAVLIHIQFWVGFRASWQMLFPDASQIIDTIFAVGLIMGVIPYTGIARKIIP